MKTNLIIGLILAAALTQSCKKGENDPFMSLKSRDARITGDWELTSFEMISVYKITEDGDNYLESETIVYKDGNATSTEIESYTMSGITETYEDSYTYTYKENMTISKDGSYSVTNAEDGDVHEYSNKWWWVDDVKSKTQISLDGMVFHVDRLTNKELVLIYSETEKGEEIDDQTTYTYESSDNYTLSYKKNK